jgi:hypothetical protein
MSPAAAAVAVADGKVGAERGQTQRDGLADALGRARDDGYLPLQGHQVRADGHGASLSLPACVRRSRTRSKMSQGLQEAAH